MLPSDLRHDLQVYCADYAPTNQAQRDACYCLDMALTTRNVVAARAAVRQAAILARRARREELAEQGFALEKRIQEVEEALYAT